MTKRTTISLETANPTFRLVRQVFTQSVTHSGDAFWTCNHSHFVADQDGDWVEKDYGNGARAYRMVLDCNPKAIERLRTGR